MFIIMFRVPSCSQKMIIRWLWLIPHSIFSFSRIKHLKMGHLMTAKVPPTGSYYVNSAMADVWTLPTPLGEDLDLFEEVCVHLAGAKRTMEG